MRCLLFSVFLFISCRLFAQEITTFQDEIPASEFNTIAITMDSTNVLIKYWDADYILINTDLAYDEVVRKQVFETDPIHVFGIENIKEEQGTLLFREKEIHDLNATFGAIGQFHTVYLPQSIESVEWIIDIPSSM